MTAKCPEMIAFAAGYRVRSDGTPVNPQGVPMKSCPRPDGRFQFSAGKGCKVKVHRLQAFQKFGHAIYEPGIHVRHLNSNHQDNSDANIALGTASENMMDKPKEIRVRVSSLANLKHDHPAIRAFFDECQSYSLTMRRFGLTSKGTLHYILNGRPAKADVLAMLPPFEE